MGAPLRNGTAKSGARLARFLRRSTLVDYSPVAQAHCAPLALQSGAQAARRLRHRTGKPSPPRRLEHWQKGE
jgi:hypothetical protein